MSIPLFDNPLSSQCKNLPQLCQPQLEGIQKGLTALAPEWLAGIRRVIITGCGDSYFAAQASIPAFKTFNKAFGNQFFAVRCLEVARLIHYQPAQSAATLVVGISASGGPARVQEALLRAKKHGCHTLAITNNPASPVAQAAECVLETHTPPFEYNGPGLRSYYASLTALYSLAAAMGEAKQLSPAGTMTKLFEAITQFTAAYAEKLDDIAAQMARLAEKWQHYASIETVADSIDFASASFVAAKFIEAAGIMAPATDSENWCHVNYFAAQAESIGTIFISNVHENNRSRIAESIFQASGVGRPVLLVSNGARTAYHPPISAAVELCLIPDPPKNYEYLGPLLNHLPGSLLASYVAQLKGEPSFRGEDSPQRKSAFGTSIATSKIKIA